ncbi:MAG: uracil phosphoribosyltransferase [Roseibacillus sp.]
MTTVEHPLIADRLTHLRNKDSSSREFRTILHNIATLMVPEVTASLATTPCLVETPMEKTDGRRITMPVVLSPILRAGLALAEGFLTVIPDATVAHIGIRRDDTTLKPEVYYPNPSVDFANSNTIVLDPMLATGGTAIEAIRILKKQGAKQLSFACVIAAPEGLEALQSAHPDLAITTAAIDRCLDKNGYICPGLGDAGDRSFGTT